MDPTLVFFIVRSLIRVGSAARDAYEQSVRDATFKMPPLPNALMTRAGLLQQYFGRISGTYKELTAPEASLSKYWLPGPAGSEGLPNNEIPDCEIFLIMAIATIEQAEASKIPAGDKRTWIALRGDNEAAFTGMLDPWSKDKAPTSPWAKIALSLADVALDYVGSNPSILGVGSNGEALIKVVCDNLQACLNANATNGPQAQFVERLGAAILQAGLKTVSENPQLIVTDKAASAVIGGVAKPLSDLFAKAVDTNDFAEQLRWANIRDTVLPQMVSGGLSALAQHQQALLGTNFDPNRTLGYFTNGFLIALSDVSVLSLGTPQGWLPIYQSMLRAVVAKPRILVPGTTKNDEAIRDLIVGVAKLLQPAPPAPFTRETALGLAQVVVDVLEEHLPARTNDPWVKLVPSALEAVLGGLRKGDVTLIGNLGGDLVSSVVRVVLVQAAATPGMIVGSGTSAEVQTIISAVLNAMTEDTKFLISDDGWLKIASVAAATAAKNPGKLFGISGATPGGELASKLISQVLSNASKGFAAGRQGTVVLFGETLVAAIEDTLTAAAGNAVSAAKNVEAIDILVAVLNKLVADSEQPIGAADWKYLYESLIPQVLLTGKLPFEQGKEAEKLRDLLYKHKLSPG